MAGEQPVWLDLQFRKSDEAMLYCGQTRLLTVTMQQANVRIDAHPFYLLGDDARIRKALAGVAISG